MHHKINTQQIETLRQAARMMVRELGLLADAYFDIGVTLAERHLLTELESCFYPDVGDIAERLLLDKSTASRLIAKAVKKGFVVYTLDKSDRRRRCLQLTEKGRETLHAVEPLAQKQVENALLTLDEEERQIVQQGVVFFAKGLSQARLRKEFTFEPIAPQDNVPLVSLLLSCLEEEGYKTRDLSSQDIELQAMYETYHQKGYAYFVIRKGLKLAGGAGIAPLQSDEAGRCELRKMHLTSEARNLGLENLLIETCLKEAQQQGYRTCYVATSSRMVQTQEFYMRHGFVRLAERKGDESPFDYDLFFEKTL